jgi:hypothetical protein
MTDAEPGETCKAIRRWCKMQRETFDMSKLKIAENERTERS